MSNAVIISVVTSIVLIHEIIVVMWSIVDGFCPFFVLVIKLVINFILVCLAIIISTRFIIRISCLASLLVLTGPRLVTSVIIIIVVVIVINH